MPAPKGTRVVAVQVSETDSIHIYSNEKRIWLQLRRNVRTEDDISAPSFKVALPLRPTEATAIADELRSLVERQQSAASPKKTPQADGASAKPSLAKKKKKPAAALDSPAPSSRIAPKIAVLPPSGKEGGTSLIVCPKCSKEAAIEHNGGLWCTDCARLVVPPTLRPSSSRSPRPISRSVVVDLISDASKNGTKNI